MKARACWIAVYLSVSMCIVADARMALVAAGKPVARITLGRPASETERIAAQELAHYLEAISGAKLAQIDADDESVSEGDILVGTADTHPGIRRLVQEGRVTLSAEDPGRQGFILRTVSMPNGQCLVIGGSDSRGALYGVYWFLERVLDCGFFEDGEHVPHSPHVFISDLDVRQRPFFELRYFPEPYEFPWNPYRVTAELLRNELTWMARRRLNLTDAFDRWELRPPDYTGFGRDRGFDFVGMALSGCEVDEAWARAHPDVRVLELSWIADEARRMYFIHPSEPLFRQRMEEELKSWVQRYGPQRFYAGGFWAEINPRNYPTSLEDRQEILLGQATAHDEAMRRFDPESRFSMDTWAWNCDASVWTHDVVERVLKTIPPGKSLIIHDMFTELAPFYREHDFFSGHDWVLGFLPTFGAENKLHGHLYRWSEIAREVAQDPRSEHCRGLYVRMESTHNNTLSTDYLFDLAWDPKTTVDEFVPRYCIRRYGSRHARALVRAWMPTVRTLFHTESSIGHCPPFLQLYVSDESSLAMYYFSRQVRARKRLIPVLLRSVRDFLAPSQRPDGEDLASNPLYVKDALLLAKQYLNEMANFYMIRSWDALRAGDADDFEVCAQRIEEILDGYERILSSHPDFRWESFFPNRRIEDPAEFKAMMFYYFPTTRLGAGLYCPWEIFEVYRLLYRRNTETYLEAARQRLRAGQRNLAYDEMEPVYRKILEEFIHTETEVPASERFAGAPLQAVAATIEEFGAYAREVPETSDFASMVQPWWSQRAPQPMPDGGWLREDFDGANIDETVWSCGDDALLRTDWVLLRDGAALLGGTLQARKPIEAPDWEAEVYALWPNVGLEDHQAIRMELGTIGNACVYKQNSLFHLQLKTPTEGYKTVVIGPGPQREYVRVLLRKVGDDFTAEVAGLPPAHLSYSFPQGEWRPVLTANLAEAPFCVDWVVVR